MTVEVSVTGEAISGDDPVVVVIKPENLVAHMRASDALTKRLALVSDVYMWPEAARFANPG